MVQKHRFTLVVGPLTLRFILVCILILVAAETSSIALDILKNILGYTTPDSFIDIDLVDPWISFEFAAIFWIGILFGILGTKFDYILISLATGFGLWDFHDTSTTTTNMYLGLIGAAILGNAIGFGLKLLRQRFLPKFKV